MTLAELTSLASAMGSVSTALVDVVNGHPTLADGETIADEAIQIGLSAVPGGAIFAQLAPVLVAILIAGIASGRITPGAAGEGQTDLGRGGRRG